MHVGSTYYSQGELETFEFRKLGTNVKIKKTAGLFFTENIEIGSNVRIDDNVIIVASANKTIIGNNIHIASNCYLAASAGLEMHDFSGLAPGVMIFTGSDDYSGKKLTNPTVSKEYIGGNTGKVILGRHVIVGAGSVILPKVTIGEGASLGALSLVTKSLEPWNIYFGRPVKKLRSRSKEMLQLEKEYLENKQV